MAILSAECQCACLPACALECLERSCLFFFFLFYILFHYFRLIHTCLKERIEKIGRKSITFCLLFMEHPKRKKEKREIGKRKKRRKTWLVKHSKTFSFSLSLTQKSRSRTFLFSLLFLSLKKRKKRRKNKNGGRNSDESQWEEDGQESIHIWSGERERERERWHAWLFEMICRLKCDWEFSFLPTFLPPLLWFLHPHLPTWKWQLKNKKKLKTNRKRNKKNGKKRGRERRRRREGGKVMWESEDEKMGERKRKKL